MSNWDVIMKKKVDFLINYLTTPRPTLTLNGTLNKKKLYAQNNATPPKVRYKY